MKNTEEFKDKNIKLISMHDEMSSSYLSYAMSVIVSRALPDVRDCLLYTSPSPRDISGSRMPSSA